MANESSTGWLIVKMLCFSTWIIGGVCMIRMEIGYRTPQHWPLIALGSLFLVGGSLMVLTLGMIIYKRRVME